MATIEVAAAALSWSSARMASTLTFDTSEPDTKALIDGWADDTEYTVTVRLKTGSGEARNAATVLEVTDEGETIPEEEQEAEEVAAPAYAPKSAAVVPK
jgi:hypothetical protein